MIRNKLSNFIILLCLIISTNLMAMNNEVKKAVLHNLAKDDIGVKIGLKVPVNKDLGKNNFKEIRTTAALNAIRVGDVVFFAVGDTIKRFDMTTSLWLTDTVTNDIITSFSADDTGVYIAHDRALYKYFTNGGPRVFFTNTASTIIEIKVFNNFIVYTIGSVATSLNKATGIFIDQGSTRYRAQGLVVQAGNNKMFGRSQGVGPSDIVSIEFDSTGNHITANDSPYHGDYPGSTRVYGLPDESRIVDGAGIVYHSGDLTYGGSLAGVVSHVAFYGNLPIVLRDENLISYSNTFIETGTYTPTVLPDLFYVFNEKIFAFNYITNDVNVETYDIALLTPDVPGEPVSPIGLIYAPDHIDYDGDDDLYILHRNSLTIFKYNISTKQYVDGIALLEAPLFMAFSQENNRIYLAYASGKITQINPDAVVVQEQGFVNSPQQPCGMTSLGELILICDPSGAWVSHFIYASDGNLKSQEDWNYFSEVYKWSKVNRKVYHFRDHSSPNDLIWEDVDVDGIIGQQQDSPYHGGVDWLKPLCVNPDGSNVLTGNGVFYDSITLAESSFLSNNIRGCAWNEGVFYSLSNDTQSTELQFWSPTYENTGVRTYAGAPIDLMNVLGDSLLIISDVAGVPTFNLYNNVIFSNGFD
jgi:hypothetical protein